MHRLTLVVAISALAAVVAMVLVGAEPDRAPKKTRSLGNEPAREVYEYVGSKRCRMCHSQWYKSWEQSVKGHSFEALKPGVSKELKLKVSLDADKDYTTAARCLVCHTVGYGQPGGYQIPEAGDSEAARLAATREGVGCESCHGPGGGFTQVMADIYKKERPYDQQEVRRAGLRRLGPELCTGCHDPKAPCIPSDRAPIKVDHEALKKGLGFHEHFPLKYRKP